MHQGEQMRKASDSKSNKNEPARTPGSAAPLDDTQRHDIIADNANWTEWFDGPRVSDDFMAQREQPTEQWRDSF